MRDAETSGGAASPENTVRLVVNGGLMKGMRAERRMIEAGAIFVRSVHTALAYRLYSIDDGFPGMIRVAANGASIAAEMYELPHAGFVSVLENEPDGLCVGRVLLADGTTALGVLAEPRLIEGRADITSYGGWRAYVEAKAIPQHPAAR